MARRPSHRNRHDGTVRLCVIGLVLAFFLYGSYPVIALLIAAVSLSSLFINESRHFDFGRSAFNRKRKAPREKPSPKIQQTRKSPARKTTGPTAYDKKVEAINREFDELDELATFRVDSVGSSASVSVDRPDPFFLSQKHVPDDLKWHMPGDPVTIGRITYRGGMVYSGSGDGDASMINPRLKVAQRAASLSIPIGGYWPSYASLAPDQRSAYLNWLSQGRNDPQADIGYVFLFYYGLERRLLVDVAEGAAPEEEVPSMIAEIIRLRTIYHHHSFRFYSDKLLGYLCAAGYDTDMNGRQDRTPIETQIEVARLVKAGEPLPGPLALEWFRSWSRSDPSASRRCPKLFTASFEHHYAKTHPDGVRLSAAHEHLVVSYHPATAGMPGATADTGGLMSVDPGCAGGKSVSEVVRLALEDINSYSRWLLNHADHPDRLDGALLLPSHLWPKTLKTALQYLRMTVEDEPRVMSVQQFLQHLGEETDESLSRARWKQLTEGAEQLGVGIEPDPRQKTPRQVDLIALIAVNGVSRSPIFLTAAIAIELACATALIDGVIDEDEVALLRQQISCWLESDEDGRRRLEARVLLAAQNKQVNRNVLKRIEVMDRADRKAIADLSLSVATVGGELTPTGARQIHRIYQRLGLELPDILHPRSVTHGIVVERRDLDMGRVARIQEESQRASTLLGRVFAEETWAGSAELPAEETAEPTLLPSLDQPHLSLLRILLTREQWTREAAEGLARDAGLMLDGALERINEAAFEAFDQPLIEGEDPYEVDTGLLGS